MGSETFPCLPVINFSKLEEGPGTPEWESVKSQVKKAVEEFGFFKVFFNKIPEEHQKEVLTGLEDLFGLPPETKKLNLSKMPNGGYIGKTFFTPLYESIGIDEPSNLENIERVASVIWPQGKPTFSKSVHYFSNQMLELDKIVKRMMLESLQLDKYLDEIMEAANYSFRAQIYEGVESNEKIVGLHPHMDNSSMTILFQNNKVDGLEVQTRDGEWINLKLSQDDFLVMIGEVFHAWSNGRWYSPYHRVTMSGDEARYSLALFSGSKPGYIIKAPEEIVDEEHPLLYRPFDFIEFLKLSRSGNSEKPYSPIKDYFGV